MKTVHCVPVIIRPVARVICYVIGVKQSSKARFVKQRNRKLRSLNIIAVRVHVGMIACLYCASFAHRQTFGIRWMLDVMVRSAEHLHTLGDRDVDAATHIRFCCRFVPNRPEWRHYLSWEDQRKGRRQISKGLMKELQKSRFICGSCVIIRRQVKSSDEAVILCKTSIGCLKLEISDLAATKVPQGQTHLWMFDRFTGAGLYFSR